jgi:16S rRNA (uracil1498-N3)-methyltransferase
VRRLTPGERVDITDGSGLVAECAVATARPGELELAVVERRTEPRPDPNLVVVQAIPKGDRGELAVELLTEVGADVIVPWAADRCVAVWRGERAVKSRARWGSAAEQAAKQSRRAWFPEVSQPVDLAGALRHVQVADLAILLDPGGSQSLATTRLPDTGQIVIIVGPEGGITDAETDALVDAGAVPVGLGPTVLRASSAGVVAAGIVLSRTARWA